jgi:predicted CXXCH cytochrome family protein
MTALVAGASGDTTPPTVPTNLQAQPGLEAPVIATLTWDASTDDFDVIGYRIWRSITTTATPSYIGSSKSLAYTDSSGVPGQPYFYRVSAYDASGNESDKSSAAGPVVSEWTLAPHATYTVNGDLCKVCHALHDASTSDGLLRQVQGDTAGQLPVCYACHDGQGASSNIKTGAENSFALVSGHTVEDLPTGGDLTNRCSGCHGVHNDYATQSKLPAKEINGAQVTGANNTWCLACHNDTNDWYGIGYPALSTPDRDASGYPVAGTFPGRTVYENPSTNAHASIPASGTERIQGDCLYCHAAHRSPNPYDGLLGTFRPSSTETVLEDQTDGTYASNCFQCHSDAAPAFLTTPPTDIKQYVTYGGPRSGHRIKTAGGTLPVGAPLPCYNCHNPHGSSLRNASLISDERGQDLDTSTAEGVRAFCFTCHTTADGLVWDSATDAYVVVGAQSIEGLARDGSGGNVLLLPIVNGHDSSDAGSCYGCHGGSYAPGGNNVHNPSGGVSQGGEGCYGCHGDLESIMEFDGLSRTMGYHHVLGTVTTPGDDPFSATTYPGSGSTPLVGTDVYCLSCHVDHDLFNDNSASNLRASIGSAAGTTARANSDFNTASPYGVCVGCHAVQRAKDTVNQKSSANTAGADSSQRTPAISGPSFAASAHQYTVNSTFGDSTSFQANCSKCHSDSRLASFQTSTFTFGLHVDNSRRLLGALGRATPISDNPFNSSDFCFRCHSVAGSPLGDGFKSTADRDWYGPSGAVMSTASQNIYRQFVPPLVEGELPKPHYNHGVGDSTRAGLHRPDEDQAWISANKHVECEDCHSAHGAGATTHSIKTNTIAATGGALSDVAGVTYASGAMNTSNWDPTAATKPKGLGTFGTSLTTATREYEICMKCHSSSNPNVWSWGSTWTDISLEFNTGNRSYHPVFGSLNSGSSSALRPNQLYTTATVGNGPSDAMVFDSPGNQTMYCSDCHGAMASDPAAMGPHGSTAPRVLKGYYPNDSSGVAYTLNRVAAGTATDLLCIKCHPMRSGNSFLHQGHDGANGHKSVTCTTCHLARPHGGKMSRLMVDHSTPRNTTTPNATPAPYRGANAGMAEFVKRPAGDYTQPDCSTGGSCGTSRHTASAARGTIENW